MSSHAHDHEIHHLRAVQRRVLWMVLGINGIFMVVEALGGLAFGSLALLADAGHTLSDVGALAVALFAQHLLDRPPTARHTYGLQRAEILGALANALTLLLVAAWVVFEALRRVDRAQDVEGAGMLLIASVGLLINVGSMWLLARSKRSSLNMRAAHLHMVLDAVGSAGAIVAAIVIIGWGWDLVDPLVSLAIAAFIVWSAWHLLRETVHVLLEGVPRGLHVAQIERALLDDEAVESVHHLHVWSVASDLPALSAHVVIRDEVSLHEAQLHGERLREMLTARYGIQHATLELECHACE